MTQVRELGVHSKVANMRGFSTPSLRKTHEHFTDVLKILAVTSVT